MRTLLIVLLLAVSSKAVAECGKLCDRYWCQTATKADVWVELNSGADVMARDRFGNTPLHFAAMQGLQCFNILLSASADVMARNDYGYTPLHYAYGDPANIKALLTAGADIMARSKNGLTPLHSAAKFGSSENIQVLLAAGADMMARSKNGLTPLHSAAQDHGLLVLYPHHPPKEASASSENIQVLLAAGADAKAKSKNGKTPWDLAQENKDINRQEKGYWMLNDANYN